MIHVHLKNPDSELGFRHSEGPLEFGRGPRRNVPRQIVNDPYVSVDQLLIAELPEHRMRIENLSEHVPVQIEGSQPIGLLSSRIVKLPAQLRIGQTDLRISVMVESDELDQSIKTLGPPATRSTETQSLRDLGDAPDGETLARWFETVICIQQSAASSSEFFNETARAVVELVGLDRGLVLLRQDGRWKIVAQHTDAPELEAAGDVNQAPEFSHRVLDEVMKTGTTYFQTMGSAPPTASLQSIEAVVAAPILDRQRQVVGVVYGSRAHSISFRSFDNDRRASGINPLEAQIIQLLAAAIGAGLERVRHQSEAIRSQLQFEQFFSSKLATELARDTNLLEGRQREVTIVFSDVRDFSLISEHLGARETFRMMQDVMDLQTSIIHQHDGVVVDYVGDGLLAMWNAPTDQPNHAKLACQAVLQIMRKLPELNEKWQGKLSRPLRLGVGVNTGIALVGNTGSRVKFKYGPMGPAVNLASRVEDATKHLGARVLLTGSTHRLLDDSFASRRLCQALLSGIAAPVDLFELRIEEYSPAWQRRRESFETALAHFTAKRWADACLAIYPLISDAEGEYDVASLQLLSRAVECLKSNPEPFDPVIDLRS